SDGVALFLSRDDDSTAEWGEGLRRREPHSSPSTTATAIDDGDDDHIRSRQFNGGQPERRRCRRRRVESRGKRPSYNMRSDDDDKTNLFDELH
uniref:Uncharacterized protein n=1 Tax=Plectus sambesii TaxID=2011161 RepID=A0A914VN84_9BILA